MGSEMLNAALEYAAAGFRVFPIKPKDKKPLLGGNWKALATSDESIIRGWWEKHPNANIAIACGHMTKGGKFITVVDMDNKPDKGVNGFRALHEWQKMNNTPLPDTLSARSGSGGLHYYFYADKAYKNGVDVLNDSSGVDSRSEGGYIIAPPSVHKCGKHYEWESGFDISRIADGGPVLDKLLTECETKETDPPITPNSTPLTITGDIIDTIAAKLGLDFGEGGRNEAIHKLASSLQARGYSDRAIFDLCARANDERCTPPLPDKEVQTAIESALKAIRKGTPRSVSAVGDFDQFTERLSVKFPFIIPHEKEKDGSIWYSVSAPILADYMLKNDRFIFLDTGGEKPPILWYSNGVYKPIDPNGFKGKIKDHIAKFDETDDKLHCSHVYDEVYKQIVISVGRVKDEDLNTRQELINFQNGLLDLFSMTLLPHSPEIYSTIQIPCSWTGTSGESPVFDTYLETLTNGDKDTQRLLLEYMGLVISNIPGYVAKSGLFLTGAGDTGKSKYLELLARLIGVDNYSETDLSRIEERFGTFALWGKRLAGSGDMSYMSVRELKTFKKITGGDRIEFEQKGKDTFTGQYNGCLLFCCNEMPKFGGDQGEHVYERMMIVTCNNVIPKEKRDPQLLGKILPESSAIIYKAVLALREFVARGYKFIVPEACNAAREAYKIENNSVLQFLEECTVPREWSDSNIFTTTGVMFSAYKSWATMNNCRYTANRSEFKRAVRERYGDKVEVKNGSGSQRGYIFELTRAAREELGGFYNG